MVLLIVGVLLLSAALMQTETSFSFENSALLSGAAPGFFIAGRFDNRTKRQRMKDNEEAVGCMFSGIGMIFVGFFYMIIWMFKIVYYMLAWPFILLAKIFKK